MKIEFDFRADMTICELIQYLEDELQIIAKENDEAIKKGTDLHIRLQYLLDRENRLCDLIDDICLQASKVDR